MSKDNKPIVIPAVKPEKKGQEGNLNEGKGSQKPSQDTELRGTGPRKPVK